MYQQRLATWKITKYNKADDMLFVLHKTRQRDAQGKKSAFIIRDRVVSVEEVTRYFKRKGGIPDPNDSEASSPVSTPNHISYSTPRPHISEEEASITLQRVEAETGDFTEASAIQFDIRESAHSLKPFSTFNLQDGYSLSYVPVNYVQQTTPFSATIPLRPSTPHDYQFPEELFLNIKTYFDSCFNCGKWVTDAKGLCINSIIGESRLEDPGNFVESINSAVLAFTSNSFVDARVMLSSVCKLVKNILKDEDPRSLDCLLEAFVILLKNNLLDVADVLRRYISAMAFEIFGMTNPEHPWLKIWTLIGSIDRNHLRAAINQSWKCTSDAFDNNIGRFNESALICYLEYIRHTFNIFEEEIQLRHLLSNCEQGNHDVIHIINIMFSMASNLSRQQRYAECEVFALRLLAQARAIQDYQGMVMGLNYVCRTQYRLGKWELAKGTALEAIELITREKGATNPLVINLKWDLTKWLREWGRDAEADRLKAEIEELIKQHDVDGV